MNGCGDDPKYDNNSIKARHLPGAATGVGRREELQSSMEILNNSVITNQHDYFGASLTLKRMYNFTKIFERNYITASNTTLYDTTSVLNVLKLDLGVDIWLQCSWRNGEYAKLVEARICVDKFFKPLNCPPNISGFGGLPTTSSYAWTNPCPKVFVVSL
ncbi:unnamed protein product [Taenia asiatica]|uniref:Glycoprotein 120 n=1 Tax=Taenia asiatica TaxID=60517 RepID=A0A0R3W691_TAEAS|nr:unnamed protein product [Taenia asiatica]